MKKRLILIFTLLITSIVSTMNVMAQEKSVIITSAEEENQPLLKAIEVGVDVGGFAQKVFGSDYTSASASVTANIKNRYLPVIEIGYGEIDTKHEETSITYKTKAPFFKIGCDYNFFFKKTHLPGYLFGGIRIAHSSFNYDVSAPDLKDPVWGNITIPFTYNDVKGSTTWSELVVGVKAKIMKNFHLGWSARYRVLLSNKKSENCEPLYIPGLGMSNSSKFGFTYNLIYNLPF